MDILNHKLFVFNELHLYHNLYSFSGADPHEMEWNDRLKIGDTNRSQEFHKFAVEVSGRAVRNTNRRTLRLASEPRIRLLYSVELQDHRRSVLGPTQKSDGTSHRGSFGGDRPGIHSNGNVHVRLGAAIATTKYLRTATPS